MRTVADSCCFPASLLTVSLQQMIKFGAVPSQGTLLKASQFLTEEVRPSSVVFDPPQSLADGSEFGLLSLLQLPVRLAHRVQDLDELPEGLSNMPSINRVKEWYAESFDVSSYSFFVGQEVPFRADLVFCGGNYHVEL